MKSLILFNNIKIFYYIKDIFKYLFENLKVKIKFQSHLKNKKIRIIYLNKDMYEGIRQNYEDVHEST